MQKKLSGCDSLAVNFNRPGQDLIENSLQTVERKAIREISGYVGAVSSKKTDCVPEGNMMFYKKGILQADISFHYSSDSCRCFIETENGELRYFEMNHTAVDFFRNLSSGNKN
jgi:hypothetical protein